MSGKVVDLSAVRARRQAEDEAFEGLEELIAADQQLEATLPRDRLTGEAIAELRIQLLPHAAEPGDALMPVSTLYALNREVLYLRALLRCVRGSWESYQRRSCTREVFENDIAAVVVDVVADEQIETIRDAEVTLAGTVEVG